MKQNGSVIITTMRYKDAPAAIKWLCDAFGFEKHLVVPGENDSDYDQFIKPTIDLNGINTQSPYIVFEKIDDHYNRAIAVGAKIVLYKKEEEYGGRGYSCLDSEGYLGNFGLYNPWA